jgi:hypothetical protein
MRSAWVIALVLIAISVCAPRAEASKVIVQGCEFSGVGWSEDVRGRRSVGEIVEIEIQENSQFARGGFHHPVQMCRNFEKFVHEWPQFRIEGPIRPFMADIFDIINSEIMSDQRLKHQFEVLLTRIRIILDSGGGDIASAMRVGRRLRALNSNISVNFNEQCHSACAVILASGVFRRANGRVGVHRPYFVALDHRETRQQVTARLNRLNAELAAYFQEMGQPAALLDAMRAVPPNQIRILSSAELQHFMLSGDDPAYEERELARAAHWFGTTSAELRRRRQLADEMCGSSWGSAADYNRWRLCSDAIKYAVTVQTLTARESRAQTVCAPILRGRPPESLSPSESERWRQCRIDVLTVSSR